MTWLETSPMATILIRFRFPEPLFKKSLDHHISPVHSSPGRDKHPSKYASPATHSSPVSTEYAYSPPAAPGDASPLKRKGSKLLHLSNGEIRIGRLVLTNTVLGYGSHGTMVYLGFFDGRQVAIKRLLLDFYHVAAHEVSLLLESDNHNNVIRYFCTEQCDRFLYIALELCDCSLADLIEGPMSSVDSAQSPTIQNLAKTLQMSRVLHQILSGVNHLHSLKIVHRDLKPHNILFVMGKGRNVESRIIISDFGLCKKLELDQSSFGATATAHHGGTYGWRAPELLKHPQSPAICSSPSWQETTSISPIQSPMRLTRAIDVFSLGCIFYYLLTGGEHPFGDKYSREINILEAKHDLRLLDDQSIIPDAVLARDMISRMITPEPSDRPSIAQLFQHPYFWPSARRLNFMQDVSNRLEVEFRNPSSDLIDAFELDAQQVLMGDWTRRIDRVLLGTLGRYRRYDGHRVLDLLRALRNKKHHYSDLAPHVRKILGPLPDGFLNYFTTRFPRLLIHLYRVVESIPEMQHDPMIASYFATCA